LPYVVKLGLDSVVKYLVKDIGDDVNWVDYFRQTPIYYAAKAGKLSTLKLLIEYGANPNV